MSRGEARFVVLANLLVGGSGIVYAAMKYLLEPPDEWSVVNHPWQPHVQHLHVLVAPLLVLAGGLLWRHHIAEKLRNGDHRGRCTGLVLVFLFVPMAASGYLIQITITEIWRQTWIWSHVVSSLVWLVGFVFHLTRPGTGAEGSSVPAETPPSNDPSS